MSRCRALPLDSTPTHPPAPHVPPLRCRQAAAAVWQGRQGQGGGAQGRGGPAHPQLPAQAPAGGQAAAGHHRPAVMGAGTNSRPSPPADGLSAALCASSCPPFLLRLLPFACCLPARRGLPPGWLGRPALPLYHSLDPSATMFSFVALCSLPCPNTRHVGAGRATRARLPPVWCSRRANGAQALSRCPALWS